MFDQKSVELPKISQYDGESTKNITTVKEGSHYVFEYSIICGSTSFSVFSNDLSQYDIKEPIRKLRNDIKLYNTSNYSNSLSKCATHLFDKELIFEMCDTEDLELIISLAKKAGCDGLCYYSSKIIIFDETRSKFKKVNYEINYINYIN
jgi:hypothetical protein